jgi:uncharacterized protein (DUF2147 family)
MAMVMTGLGNTAGATARTWTIQFTGSGSFDSNATQNSGSAQCTDVVTSATSSEFSWSVTWHNVSLVSPANTGNVTGTLTGTTHESYKQKAGRGCGDSSTCSKDLAFHADESSAGSNPAVLIGKTSSIHKGNYVLILDLISGADEEQECQSVDPNDGGFYFAGTQPSPGATDPLAASTQIPVSELQASGKIIVLVKKSPFAYPQSTDCSDTSLDLTCSHNQTWSGTITMTRS